MKKEFWIIANIAKVGSRYPSIDYKVYGNYTLAANVADEDNKRSSYFHHWPVMITVPDMPGEDGKT